MDLSFWRGRSVLITGHTGFKGAWLSLWLHRLGAEVTGFALEPPSQPNLYSELGLTRDLRSLRGDVRDRQALEEAFAAAQPEVVLHLAAQSLVRPSYQDPVHTWSTNVIGTIELLEAVRRNPEIRAVVVVTTDKCYQNREWLWPYREDDALGGHDPYSGSKAGAELATASCRASFFGPEGHGAAVATARAGNVIGGGDWALDRLIPDAARAALAGRALQIRSPRAIRPWQHVLEPLAGYLHLAQRLVEVGKDYAEAWNFGPEEADARPVAEVLTLLSAAWGPDLTWEEDPGSHPHEARLLKLDSSKARCRLGWRPRLGLEPALQWVAQWYRAHAAGESIRSLSEDQLARYEALVASSS